MKKYELGFKAGLIALAVVLTVLINLLLCSNVNAGDYKSCIIKYKTDAGLCQQIEDVLNVVDTIDTIEAVADTMFVVNKFIHRQYRGLTVESVPKWSMATFNYVLIDSVMIKPGKAILTWEEVEK